MLFVYYTDLRFKVDFKWKFNFVFDDEEVEKSFKSFLDLIDKFDVHFALVLRFSVSDKFGLYKKNKPSQILTIRGKKVVVLKSDCFVSTLFEQIHFFLDYSSSFLTPFCIKIS